MLNGTLFVEHTWSKVGLSLEAIKKYDDTKLPSKFNLYQIVSLHFNKIPILATVRGVHFFNNIAKYDLQLWLPEQKETRIYNGEEKYLKAK